MNGNAQTHTSWMTTLMRDSKTLTFLNKLHGFNEEISVSVDEEESDIVHIHVL